MKLFLSLAVVLIAQGSAASQLECTSRSVGLRAQFDGRAKVLTSVAVVPWNSPSRHFDVGEFDPNYRPRNPERDMVRYNLMASRNARSGVSVLLPRVKGRDVFGAILVGREHEYHGEPTYEGLSCRLIY